jgi:hypothetical protein
MPLSCDVRGHSASRAHSQAESPEFCGQFSLRGTYVGYDVAVDRSSKRCRRPRTMVGPELWRSVKPSAKPTLVRTQHLPPPAKIARELGFPGLAGLLVAVPPCFMVCRCVAVVTDIWRTDSGWSQRFTEPLAPGFSLADFWVKGPPGPGDHWLSACSCPCTPDEIRGRSQVARTLLIPHPARPAVPRDLRRRAGEVDPATPKTQ